MTTASRLRLRLVGDERLVDSVRRGDAAAFEAMYDRHSAELLSFCVYMLGSRHDAEDAVQATFASAYRALRSDRRAVNLRPWLFAIARNNCLTILRRRRPWAELNGEPALNGDPLRELELREEIRLMIEGLRALPESQRASLVLAELHGFSQAEIGSVLGVQAEQVKAFICQARSNLISERTAREADCREIREELATARGAALLRGRLRRHLRSCDDCRTYADGVARQRRHLGVLLPLAPSLVLKYRALEEALGTGGGTDAAGYAGGAAVGGSVAGTAAEVAGGGFKALALKIAAGVACLGTSAGAGASVLMSPPAPPPLAQVAASPSGAKGYAPAAALAADEAPRTGRSGSAGTGRELTGSSTISLRSGTLASGPGAGRGAPAPGAGEASEAYRRRLRAERIQHAEEQQRAAEEENRHAREQRPPGATAESLAARERALAERRATVQPRVDKTEAERQRAHEERVSSVASRPPRRTKEQRQRERQEHKPEQASRPPKSEAERQRALEERRRRHEEKKAAAGG